MMSISDVMLWLLIMLCVSEQCFCQTEFRFANIYGDNMVLQQSPYHSQIWGYSTTSMDFITAKLIVSSTNSIVETVSYTTNTNLIWIVQFSPVAGMNDYEYAISVTSNSTSKTISLTNILFGDLYVCSGQSNMQFTVDQAFNASQEVEAANDFPNIRVFSVSQHGSDSPQMELSSIQLEWVKASNKSIGGGDWTYFSAVCWFFGRNIYNELLYPIGLIASSYGGTPIEDWMAPEALALCSNNNININSNDSAANTATMKKKKDEEKLKHIIEAFQTRNRRNNNNDKYNMNNKNNKNTKNNGKNAKSTEHAAVIKKQQDVQTTMLSNTNNKRSFFNFSNNNNLGYPNSTDLWNAMIYPLLFQTIKGVIWYQGETDRIFPHAPEYACTFPSMINSWRYYWSSVSDTSSIFPFGFVQLSTWDDTTENKTCGNDYECTGGALVRYGQTGNYSYVPNPKMSENIYFAAGIDLGDVNSPYGDVHTRYKQQIAKRLSDAAMNVVYGDTNGYPYIQGPFVENVISNSVNNSLIINFRNVGEKGLEIKNSIGFEVYSVNVSSNVEGWIDAPLKNEIKVVGFGGYDLEMILDIEIVNVTDVEYVRYNWYTAPCQPTVGIYMCAVYDMQYALPAIPFVFQVNQG